MPIKQKFNLASIQGIDLHLNLKRNTETFGNNSCACGSDFDSIIDDPLNTNENSKTHFDEFFLANANGQMATSWQDSFSQQSDSMSVVKKSTADMSPSQFDIFFRETSMVNFLK